MAGKIKVAVINEGGPPTGTYYYLINLAERLQTLGLCDITLVTHREENISAKQLILKPWLMKIPLIGRPLWFFSLYCSLHKYKFDVIHSSMYGMIRLFPFHRYDKTLKVTMIADMMPHKKEYRTNSLGLYFIIKVLQPLHMKFNDIIVTISKNSKKDIVKISKIKPEKINVIYLGVSDDFKRIKDKKKLQNVIKKYKLPESFVFNAGSALKYSKNILNMLASFSEIAKKNKSVEFIFTNKLKSKNAYEKEIIRTINSFPDHIRKRIRFLGGVSYEELKALYTLADVFFMPSFEEGFGMPILEAMAAETPVITSSVSCMPEVGGNAVLYVNPYDVSDMTKKLEKALSNDSDIKKLIELGRKRVKEFTWDKTAKETYALYKRMLK